MRGVTSYPRVTPINRKDLGASCHFTTKDVSYKLSTETPVVHGKVRLFEYLSPALCLQKNKHKQFI